MDSDSEIENKEEPKFAPSKTIRDKKNIFLTYPKCNYGKDYMIAELRKKLEFRLKDYVITREFHEDGTPHIHAYLRLDPVLKVRDMKFFNIGDRHPNI